MARGVGIENLSELQLFGRGSSAQPADQFIFLGVRIVFSVLHLVIVVVSCETCSVSYGYLVLFGIFLFVERRILTASLYVLQSIKANSLINKNYFKSTRKVQGLFQGLHQLGLSKLKRKNSNVVDSRKVLSFLVF